MVLEADYLQIVTGDVFFTVITKRMYRSDFRSVTHNELEEVLLQKSFTDK